MNKHSSACVFVVGIYISEIMRLAYLLVALSMHAILLLQVTSVIMHFVTLKCSIYCIINWKKKLLKILLKKSP